MHFLRDTTTRLTGKVNLNDSLLSFQSKCAKLTSAEVISRNRKLLASISADLKSLHCISLGSVQSIEVENNVLIETFKG